MSTHIHGSLSPCHRKPRILVKSRPGGFITQNCPVCGKPDYLPMRDTPKLRCGKCRTTMHCHRNSRKNYAYICGRCGNELELHTILPEWRDEFDYHGFGLYSDQPDRW